MWNEKVGGRVRTARKARGLTQEQLARAIGSNNVYIANIETGKKKPSTDFLQKIADATERKLE